MRYTENGTYLIDSNPVEQGQRPSVLGRKNYLFSQNDRGAEDNAIFYTFIVSCESLGVNPLHWLKYTLEKIRPDMDETELIKLFPYNYKEEIEDKYFVPFVITSLIVVGWFSIVKDPYQPFRELTPSYSTSGWLWTTGAAWLMCIPFGLALGFIGLITEVKPSGTWMLLVVVIMGLWSAASMAIMLFKVYNPWLIWIGMGGIISLTFLFKKWLPGEMDVDDSSSSSTSIPMTTSNSSSSSRGYERSYPQTERRESRSSSSSSSSRSESE